MTNLRRPNKIVLMIIGAAAIASLLIISVLETIPSSLNVPFGLTYYPPAKLGQNNNLADQAHNLPKNIPVGTVLIEDNYFYPQTLRVKFGDTVTWKNLGSMKHTVTFYNLSKTLEPGETWSWPVSKDYFQAGENNYWCDFHRKEGMTAVLAVDN